MVSPIGSCPQKVPGNLFTNPLRKSPFFGPHAKDGEAAQQAPAFLTFYPRCQKFKKIGAALPGNFRQKFRVPAFALQTPVANDFLQKQSPIMGLGAALMALRPLDWQKLFLPISCPLVLGHGNVFHSASTS